MAQRPDVDTLFHIRYVKQLLEMKLDRINVFQIVGFPSAL